DRNNFEQSVFVDTQESTGVPEPVILINPTLLFLLEPATTVAQEERVFTVKTRDVKINKVVFVQIACANTERLTGKIESYLRRHFLKRPIALIAEKLNGRAVIDHQKINVALVVVIGRDDRRGLVFSPAQARLRGDVREAAVAVVAIEFVLFAGEIIGEDG